MSDPYNDSNPNNRQTGVSDPIYEKRQAETLVMSSLILGIVGMFTCGLPAIIGLVMIIIARRRGEAERSQP